MQRDTINYWWMNTNPADWRVREYPVGYDDTERTHNDFHKPRSVYGNFKAAAPGDLMIGYETSPTKLVLAVYKVTKGIHQDPKDGECIGFKIERFVNKPISWGDVKVHPVLMHSKMVRTSNRGTLYSLTSEEYHAIVNLTEK